ncbi:MAG: isoleucine--tRNA ligase [Bdellovibrionales bacterium]|nr:isoleucine--tRNA ligase [Bdellovibrionales bacterium]
MEFKRALNVSDLSDKYKETILLPKTDFPMKANMAENELKRIRFWTDNQIHEKMIDANKERGDFCMPDGPPYANGDLHLGHVLNKVLKDMVIKSRNMMNYRAPFIPGWDCHGLPIELKVTSRLGEKRKSMTDTQVRDECRKEANKWVERQKEQFIRLGVIARWSAPWLTLQPDYEAEEVRLLGKILDNGVLYRGEKPVYWDTTLQTALAAAEVEYQDHKSPSIYVKFFIEDGLDKIGNPKQKTAFVIWTTTPWTLPANFGICLNKDFEYGLYSTGTDNIIIAKELKEKVEEDTKVTLTELKTFKGSELEGMKARHPFLDRDSLVILGDHVTTEAGTGCVHTAPGHGIDDYNVGIKYDLPVYSPVDGEGKFTEDVDFLKGTLIWDANKIIGQKLDQSGHLMGLKFIKHSYPHGPRSKAPLIFRATPQWFIRMDDDNYNVRKKTLELVESKIRFVPNWGQQRMRAMISNSPDWCISRQRAWGVPIPVLYCQDCGEALMTSEFLNSVADKMEKSGKGIEAYFTTDDKELAGNRKCSQCGSQNFKKGTDILDVWFDSGVCHAAVQRKNPDQKFPADIYLEGSDQHRGWFQTSLTSSIAATGEPPFEALVTHGFVNDAQGKKMSKSLGNGMDPADVIKQSGAEILRLWVAHEDYGQDVTAGDEMLKRMNEAYRRFRNTFRFMLGNLNDFDPQKDMVEFSQMPELDQWALIRLNQLTEKCWESYENYQFFKVFHALNNFFVVDLSATYLDILKDRLYTWKQDGPERRASQTVIFHLVNHLTRFMAPLTSFLSEEAYEYFIGKSKESIFMEPFLPVNSNWKNDSLVEKFDVLLEIRSSVSKVLEDLRRQKVIGSSLDALVKITAPEKTFKVLEAYQSHLKELFIVSAIEIIKGSELKIEAIKAKGEKCVRCWHYSEEISTSSELPGICPKCVKAFQ